MKKKNKNVFLNKSILKMKSMLLFIDEYGNTEIKNFRCFCLNEEKKINKNEIHVYCDLIECS